MAWKDGLFGSPYLTTGQMARLNCISEKTLHFYQEKGIFEPRYVDESSGYRYYSIDQCPLLDCILELKTIGFSLDEIKHALDDSSIEHLQEEVQAHLEELLRKQRDLSVSIKVAQEFLSGYHNYLSRGECGVIRLEELPERRALIFDVPEQDPDAAQPLCVQWEPIRKLIKQEICTRNLPISLYRNVGRMITADRVADRDIRFNKAYVFVDDSFGELFETATVIPGGAHLTLYSEHCINVEMGGVDTERDMILQMLDEMEAQGFEPNGDYFADVIAEGPASRFEGRDAYFRLCLPVRPAAKQ